jgi:dipeptidyl-peptidase-4
MTLVAASVSVTPAHAQQKLRLSTLDDAQQASVILAGRGMPRGIAWLGSGDRYAFVATNPRTNRPEVRVYDPATGRDTVLVAPDELRVPSTTKPFEYRAIQYSRDASTLVFQTNFRPIFRRSGISDFYLYSLADRSLRIGGRDARTAELSPDGKMLGEERAGDLYVVDLAAGRERRLTHDATEHVFNGHFDWVYEEEFGLSQAWQWSPDSRRIAYWQVDEARARDPAHRLQRSPSDMDDDSLSDARRLQSESTNRRRRCARRADDLARPRCTRRLLHPAHLLDEPSRHVGHVGPRSPTANTQGFLF